MPTLSDNEIKRIRNRILVAREANRVGFAEEHHTEQALRYYQGYQWAKQQSKEPGHQVTVNYILAIVSIKVAALAADPPYWIGRPKSESSAQLAQTVQAALSHFWPDTGGQRADHEICLDKHLYGTGVSFTGWRYEAGAQRQEGRPGRVSSKARWDCPSIRRVDPHKFFPDPEQPDLTRMSYCVEEQVVPLGVLREDNRLENTADLKGELTLDKRYIGPLLRQNRDPEGLDEDLRRVRLWHYWSYDGQHVVLSEELKDQVHLIEDSPYDYPRGAYPYDVIQHIPIPGAFYGMSEFEVLWHQQEELNKTRTQLMRHRSSCLAKILADERTLTKKVREALRSAEAVAVVPLALQRNQNIRSVLDVMQPPPMGPEAYRSAEAATQDLTVESGVTEYQRGLMAPQARTATEVAAVQGSPGGRLRSDILQWARFLVGQGTKVVSLLGQFDVGADVPIYDRVTQAEEWRRFQGRDLKDHQWSIEISLQRLLAQVRDLERALVVQVAGILLPQAQALNLNVREFITQLLRRFDFDPQELLLPVVPTPVAPPGLPAVGAPGMGPPGMGPGLPGAGGGTQATPEMMAALQAIMEESGTAGG